MRLRPVVIGMFLLALGWSASAVTEVVMNRWRSCGKYDLLNPQIPCHGTVQQGEIDYEPLRDTLTAMKASSKDMGKVTHLSIYFRDLYHGPRFGIGEYDKFQPASLLKVPVMVAFLHAADQDPSVLDKTLSYSGSLHTLENVENESETIEADTPYTIKELIAKMIVYSDNYSSVLLVEELNAELKLSAYFTFRDLDVLSMMLAPKADEVSIQSYANLFAILYNTGYLSKQNSQYALELLSESTFRDGLVAGVPATVRVAHKFGRKILSDTDSQLHDCGIIYHPAGPYILCVMTSGTDYAAEKSVIADISRAVYAGVSDINAKFAH
jgi:beta-lactamase class A